MILRIGHQPTDKIICSSRHVPEKPKEPTWLVLGPDWRASSTPSPATCRTSAAAATCLSKLG